MIHIGISIPLVNVPETAIPPSLLNEDNSYILNEDGTYIVLEDNT